MLKRKMVSPVSGKGHLIRVEDVVNVIEGFDDLKVRLSKMEKMSLAEMILDLVENGPPIKTYRVCIPEIHWSIRTVKARDKEEALDVAADADEERTEFFRTLEEQDLPWEVTEVT